MLKNSILVPSFETDRLILKPITLKDAPAYEKGFVDYEVIRHMAIHVPWPYPLGGVQKFLSSIVPAQGKTTWCWGFFLKTPPNDLIGSVQLKKTTSDNRGFWLAKPYWGKGYMTEALNPVTDYAFDSLNFEKLLFTNAKGNHRSHNIHQKTGANLVKTCPTKSVDPCYTEAEYWELTKENWKKRNLI